MKATDRAVETGIQMQAMSTSVMCQGLDREAHERLFCISSVQHIPAKTAIYFEGDLPERLFEVLEGVVKLYQMTLDGHRQITGFAYPGQVFGLGWNGTCPTTAEALTSSRLCSYPLAKLERIAVELPTFGVRLFRMISAELVAAHGHMLLLGRKSAIQKMASFLLALSHRNLEQGADPDQLHLPMTRTDIADYLGLTIETVSRTITLLCRMGVIALPQRHDPTILNILLLMQMAEGERSDFRPRCSWQSSL